MKKIIFTFFFLVFSLLAFGNSENLLTGKILRYHQNQHNGISVTLRDESENIISKTETIFTGDFYFEEIPDGKYILEISDMNDSKRNIEVTKNGSKKDIGEVLISSENFYGIYLFSNVILLITVLINIVILYFMRKGKELKGKKYAILSIFCFNLWFIIEFIRFIIGIFDENLAANLWALSDIGTAYVTIFLMMFFLNFPVKRFNEKISIITKGIVGIITITLIITLIWIYMPSKIRFDEAIRVKSNVFMLIFYIENLVFLVASMGILLYNMRKYKNRYEGEISKILFISFMSVVGLLVFSITILSMYSIKEVFDGYYKTVFALMDIILYWSILKYGMSFRYMRKYRGLSDIFVEIFKYLIIMLIVFSIVNIVDIGSKEHIPMYFTVFVFLKVAFDIYFKIKTKADYISDDAIVSKLESVNTKKEIEYILFRELKQKLNIEQGQIIYKNEFDEASLKYFENIGIESDIIEEIEENKETRIGFKIRFNKEIIAVMMVSCGEEKPYFTRKETDFLINLSENIAHIVNSVVLAEAKNRMFTKEKNKTIEENSKSKGNIIYIKGYIDIIKRKTEDKEIQEYCDIILKKLESEERSNEGV